MQLFPSNLELEQLKAAGDWSNPLWRLNNLYTVVNKDGKSVPFKMNPFQQALFDDLWHRNCILKARQLGFTTLVFLFALDQAIFNRNFKSAFIADTLTTAVRLFAEKVKAPFDALPKILRDMIAVKKMNETEIEFHNGSSIQCGLTARGGTKQLLHASEFAKICAMFPSRATEIVTGAFEAVPKDGFIFVESTAEGQSGPFYDMCKNALDMKLVGAKLTNLDFRFHFFPWWLDSDYSQDSCNVAITDNHLRYFEELNVKHGVRLDQNQINWWVTKEASLQGNMKREYPAYPEEAFEKALEGAVIGAQLLDARKQNRITDVPWDPSVPVNTFWDLGVSDDTVIWFHQKVGLSHRFIRHYKANGYGTDHYWKWMNKFDYTWDKHYLPHDADKRIQGQQISTIADDLRTLGMKNIEIIPRIPTIQTGVQKLRARVPLAYFDKTNCADGIKDLDHYVFEWDKSLGRFRDVPLENWACHSADALRQWAQAEIFNVSRPPSSVSRPQSYTSSNWKRA